MPCFAAPPWSSPQPDLDVTIDILWAVICNVYATLPEVGSGLSLEFKRCATQSLLPSLQRQSANLSPARHVKEQQVVMLPKAVGGPGCA